MKTRGFDYAVQSLNERIKKYFEFLPESIKGDIEEIRLRVNLPIALTIKGRTLFLRRDGNLCSYITRDLAFSEESDIAETVLNLCNHSVYAHTSELKDGYIMLKGGNRAGVCGNFSESGSISGISSVNIRIAHEIKGCADGLLRAYNGKGMLIAGPPGSGKTTVLRDLIRQLSSADNGKNYRISVIDSRGELSGGFSGRAVNDLGSNTDISVIADKAKGIEMALRTMFPEVIAFDEVGTVKEVEAIAESLNAGVSVIATAHAGSMEELYRRPVTKSLLSLGAIDTVCLLPQSRDEKMQIIPIGENTEKKYA